MLANCLGQWKVRLVRSGAKLAGATANSSRPQNNKSPQGPAA
jgi:hypothetical protein